MPRLYEARFIRKWNKTQNHWELVKIDEEQRKRQKEQKKSVPKAYTAENAEALAKGFLSGDLPGSKWNFYIAGYNQTLGKEAKVVDPKKAAAWLKRQKVETVATVGVGLYGKPVLRIDPVTKVIETDDETPDVDEW